MSRRDAAWLADILTAIDAIGDYLKQGSLDQGLVYDACRARLIEIGEAVKHLDPALVAAAPAVRWRAIARMRDQLAHHSWTDDELTTFEYIHLLRVRSGLGVGEVARRAGVTAQWLEQFETGLIVEGINYDQLLALVRATQPERPEWWDCGHEHDLHLPPSAVRGRERHPDYWAQIDQVRDANRRARGE